MRLVKRTQPEEGMVYAHSENKSRLFVAKKILDTNYFEGSQFYSYDKMVIKSNQGLIEFETHRMNVFQNQCVGKIGFNYKWEDGKLIKIKLPDVSIDDVFETDIGQSFVSHSTETNPKNKVQGNWFDIDGSILSDKNTCMKVGYLIEDMKHKGNLAYSHKIEGGV